MSQKRCAVVFFHEDVSDAIRLEIGESLRENAQEQHPIRVIFDPEPLATSPFEPRVKIRVELELFPVPNPIPELGLTHQLMIAETINRCGVPEDAIKVVIHSDSTSEE